MIESRIRSLAAAPKILVAEDEAEVRGYLDIALRSCGLAVELVEDGEEVLARLKENGADYSLLLLDLMMPRKDGIETLREVRQFDTGLPIIMLSSAPSPLHVVDAIKSGASDFLAKPISHEDLHRAIHKALRLRPAAGPAAVVDAAASDEPCFASSPWTRKLDMFLKQVGSADVPVLLQGETGVGKEVLARKINACSPRAKRPFLKLNCAALPSELVESELFGYERGAFTGAFRNTPGKFEMADGGTILLDEIGDMDFKLQAKLLQVLQDGEFLRLGAKETCKVDVRVIAATHCNLERAIFEGRFREDLYYRLNIVRIEIPPLRERAEEILPLAQHFLKKYSDHGKPPVEISPRLRQVLMAHSWPGNIRELENAIRKLVVLREPEMVADDLIQAALRRQISSSGNGHVGNIRPSEEAKVPPVADVMEPSDLEEETVVNPVAPSAAPHSPAPDGAANGNGAQPKSILGRVDEARRQAEIEAILSALHASLWNRKQAANLLSIEYKALLYKMKKLGIGERPLGTATVA